ncbi:MAG: phage tail protein I [Bacteroidota bacterium]
MATNFRAPYSEHLLPPNATEMEQAMSATSRRLLDIPRPLRELWRPETCPVEQLPWLAWALSVDVWNPEWSEARKRAVIAASVDVHRHKGTRYAIRKALEALDVGCTIQEWFEYGGEPYRFRISFNVPAGQALSAADVDAVYRTAIANKNVRSFLEQTSVKRGRETVGFSVGSRTFSRVRIRNVVS